MVIRTTLELQPVHMDMAAEKEQNAAWPADTGISNTGTGANHQLPDAVVEVSALQDAPSERAPVVDGSSGPAGSSGEVLYGDTKQCWCFPSETYFAARPRLKSCFMTLIFAPPTFVASLLLQMLDASISSKGLLLFVGYKTVIDLIKWLCTMCAFFWFYQQAAISKLVGEAKKDSIGGSIVMSTMASGICGILTMIIALALAEPMLDLFSPQDTTLSALGNDSRTLIKDLGIEAFRVISICAPAVVYNYAGMGILMGLHKLMFTVIAAFSAYMLFIVGSAISLAPVQCESSEGVCGDYKLYLIKVSAFWTIGQWCAAIAVLIKVYLISRERGYPLIISNFTSSNPDIRNVWVRDTAWVAVRCIVNNTRRIILLLVAVRTGMVQGAVWSMFVSLSELSYNVTGILSSIAMIQVSRYLGEKKERIAVQILSDYRIFGCVAGSLFALRLIVLKDSTLATYVNDQESLEFAPVANSIWVWIVFYQIIYSLLGVYSNVISGFQSFIFWGKTVVCAAFGVFMPLVIAAVYTQNFQLLVAAEVGYSTFVLVSMYVKLHFFIVPALLREADSSDAAAAADTEEGEGVVTHSVSVSGPPNQVKEEEEGTAMAIK